MNILGEEYKLVYESQDDDKKLKNAWGYADWTTKRIVLDKNPDISEEALGNQQLFMEKVLRHEIIHAYFEESGLSECCSYAFNEELVDWIAKQMPKIVKTCVECECLEI